MLSHILKLAQLCKPVNQIRMHSHSRSHSRNRSRNHSHSPSHSRSPSRNRSCSRSHSHNLEEDKVEEPVDPVELVEYSLKLSSR